MSIEYLSKNDDFLKIAHKIDYAYFLIIFIFILQSQNFTPI